MKLSKSDDKLEQIPPDLAECNHHNQISGLLIFQALVDRWRHQAEINKDKSIEVKYMFPQLW